MIDKYIGTVEETRDEKRILRLKVRVLDVYGDIPLEHLPWAHAAYQSTFTKHSLPAIGATVYIKFLNNDILYPIWWTDSILEQTNGNFKKIENETDYTQGTIYDFKKLETFGGNGFIDFSFLPTIGFSIKVRFDDSTTNEIIIRKDNTIYLDNSKYKLHITQDNISLGSENKSLESAVMGEQNEMALNKLNEFVNELSKNIDTNLVKLATSASANPYTAQLAPVFTEFKTELLAMYKKTFLDIQKHIPKTLSKIVTLD